jgi:uncharacterized protein YcfJ
MRDDYRALFLALSVAAMLAGCARTQSPVLYPNAHLQQVGQEQADRDIEACRQQASQNVPSAGGKEIARDTAVGAVGGAAVGAVAGAVTGHGAGRGAAVGAATGGTAGAVHGTAKQIEPSHVYKNYVNRCLREKGYEVIGWQ